jgi:uncharacterized protein
LRIDGQLAKRFFVLHKAPGTRPVLFSSPLRMPVDLLGSGNRMKNGVVPVSVMGVIPTSRGCAIFIGNKEKTFTIYVELTVGQAIAMFLQGTQKERPLTHDLIGHIFKGLGVGVERVVINDLKNGTYFARLILRQDNELGQKLIEIDARPSDCLALAVQAKAPIFVSKKVFEEVEDMSEVLKKINEMQGESSTGQTIGDFDSAPSSFDVDEPEPEEDEPEEEDEGEDEDDSPPPSKS